MRRLPTIRTDGLRGGGVYYDGQFDDARFLISVARTAANHGAVLLNYAQVTGLTRGPDGVVDGVIAWDIEQDRKLTAPAGVVINATGPFADGVRRLADRHDFCKGAKPRHVHFAPWQRR